MIKDAIEYVANLARRAQERKPQYMRRPNDSGWELVLHDGTIADEPFSIDSRDLRSEFITNIGDFIARINKVYVGGTTFVRLGSNTTQKAVHVGDDNFNDGRFYDRIIYRPVKSGFYRGIHGLFRNYDAPNLIRMIRANEEFLPDSGQLLLLLRNFSWESGVSGSSQQSVGKANYGESTRAEISSEAGEFPSNVDISFNPFVGEELALAASIPLEIDPKNKRFELIEPTGLDGQFEHGVAMFIETQLASSPLPESFKAIRCDNMTWIWDDDKETRAYDEMTEEPH